MMMTSEYKYLLLFWFGLTLYYVLHSVMASDYMKRNFLIKGSRYRLFYNVLSILGLVALWGINRVANIDIELWKVTSLLELLSQFFILIGVVIMVVGFQGYSLKEFIGIGEQKRNVSLNVTGLNKYVRHPLYFGALILMYGALLTNPSIKFISTILITTVYLVVGTKSEERKLVKQFGEEYLNYKRNVKMIIPFIY